MRSATVRLIHQPLLELHATRPQQQRSILYVCSNCRHEITAASPFPSGASSSTIGAIGARRFLSSTGYRSAEDDGPNSFTERLRRRIWGTDQPPGMKDPYGGEGVIERNLRRRREANQQEAGQESIPEEEMDREVEQAEEDFAPRAEPYKPAKTWAGLERIGSLKKARTPSEADNYDRFMAARKLLTREHIHLAAHQTAVELCLMHDLKKPLTDVCTVIEHEKEIFEQILQCSIAAPAGGSATGSLDGWLSFPNEEGKDILHFVFQQIGSREVPDEAATTEETLPQNAEELEASAETVVDAARPVEESAEEFEEEYAEESVEEAEADIQPIFFGYPDVLNTGFLALPLTDPATKFAFLKRFSQISGHHIPDFPLSKIHTVQQLVDYIQKTVIEPPPKKLAETLQANEELVNLPNVKIFGNRRNRMHADEEVGRKKLIDEAFQDRGLFLRKNVR